MKIMKLLLALVVLIFTIQSGFTQEIMNREAIERPINFIKKKEGKLVIGSRPAQKKDFQATGKQKLQPTQQNRNQAPKSNNPELVKDKKNLHKRASKPANKHKNRWG